MTSKRLRHLGAALVGAAFLTASAGLVASPGQEPGAAQQPAGKADDGQPSPDDQVEALVREYDDVRGRPDVPARPGFREGSREDPSRAKRRPASCIRTSPGDSWRWPSAIRGPTRRSRRSPGSSAMTAPSTRAPRPSVPGRSSPGTTSGATGSRRSSPRRLRSSRGPPRRPRTCSAACWSAVLTTRSAASPATGWRSSSSSGRIACGSGNCWGARLGATTVGSRAARSSSP